MSTSQDIREDTLGNAGILLNDGVGNALTSTTISAKQALDVNVANSIAVGVADETAFTYGTSTYLNVGGVFNSSITALTSGQGGVVALTASRSMHAAIYDAAGVAVGDTNAHGLFVKLGDGTNTGSFSATSEQLTQLRQGGNVANVTAGNELKVIDTNAGLLNAKFSPTTSTLSQVALSSSSQVALASNAARKGFVAVNDSSKLAYVAFAATATTGAYSYKIQPNTIIEPNFGSYTGIISVISVSGVSGNLVLTELT